MRNSFRSITAILALCVLMIGSLFTGFAAAAETAPPTTPNLTVTERSSSSVTLAWNASPESRISYEVYQNAVKIAETAEITYTATGLTAGGLYSFRVKAKDPTGTLSTGDNTISLLIPLEGTAIDPLPVVTPIVASGSKGVTPGSTGFSGTVNLSVTVSDDVTEKAAFYVKVASAPEKDYWKFPTTTVTGNKHAINWSSSSAPEGEVSVKVVVTGKAGQSVTLYTIIIADNQPDVVVPPSWKPAPTPPATRMVGYFAGWSTYSGYNIETQLDASRITHLNYAFAAVKDHKIVIGDPGVDPQNFAALAKVKAKYPHLKTMISVGGWSWSAGFSEAAATAESRAIFANSAVNFIKTHGFDGVDLDWEYPVTGAGPGTYPNPADKENYPLLLQAVREKLDEQGAKDGRHYLLTIAGAATAGFARNTTIGLSHQYLDYVQVMTYDIHGTWESLADFNAPLFDAGGETYSVDKGIQAYLDAGVPADKIVMGVPFYGYRYKVTAGTNNGLRQTYTTGGSITYNTLVNQRLTENGYTRYWHEGSQVPYLYSAAESIFITYDDPQSLRMKTDYIRAKQLGGVMIWELTQDHQIDLLETLYTELNTPILDTTAPSTSASVAAASEQNGWYTLEATVTLTATDNWMAPLTTEYSIDGGEWTVYAGPVLVGEGAHTFAYRSTDAAGNVEAVKSLPINVDLTAPTLTVTLDKTELWPANHELVQLTAVVEANDGAGLASVELTSITSNETLAADDVQGAEFGTLDTTFSLRAERAGKGEGRFYTITYTATDLAGRVTTASAIVTVPHDQGQK